MKRYWCLLIVLGLAVEATAAEHVPWRLEGAQDRIEKHRMGECSLEVLMPDGSTVPAGTRIELEQTRHAFHFGGSLTQGRVLHQHESYTEYKRRFADLFNYATIGFYWSSHERKPGRWRLRSYTKEAMDWAIGKGMTVKGHPLMWHNTAPSWIGDTQRDLKDIDRDIMSHVRMLVQKYPQIDQWDMYNETPGIRLYPPEYGVRRWVESLGGPGPVTQRLAAEVRKIRPDGFFALNHFSYSDPEYHEQISYCIENKVKFDAIGIQSHMHRESDLWSEDQMWDTLEKYAEYNKPIQLTEVSVLSCELMEDWKQLKLWEESIQEARKANLPEPFRESVPELERYQAEYTRDFYTLAFSHPGIEAIVWWSVSDHNIWRGMPAGLLDVDGKRKPVYEMLDKLINHDWRTKTHGLVNKKGHVPVKGFYGTYEVRLEHKGKTLTGVFDLIRNQPNVSVNARYIKGEIK